MGFGSRLEHTVTIMRRTSAGESEYGQDEYLDSALATVKAAIQPRAEREVDQTNQVGAGITEHTVYLLPTDIEAADYLLHDQGDCALTDDLPHLRLEIEGIRNAAGRGHHLEIAARAVQSTVDVTGS